MKLVVVDFFPRFFWCNKIKIIIATFSILIHEILHDHKPGVTKRHHKIGRNPVSMVPRKWLSSIHLKIHRAMKNEKNLHRGIFLELGKSCKIKSETYLYPFFGILKGFFSWLMIQKKVYGGKKKNIFIHDRQVKHYEISFEGKIWFLSISFSRVESWKVNLIFH